MKNKDEQTGLVGLAIGAAVLGVMLHRRRRAVSAPLDDSERQRLAALIDSAEKKS